MLDELTQELARLYADSDSARRVAADASIPEQLVEFDGPAIDAWRRIVSQADKRGVLANLLRVVTKDYPNNSKLQRMYGVYLYGAPPSESQIAVGQGRESKGRTEPATAVRFQEIVEQLDSIVNGNPRLRIVGLADLVDAIEKSVQAFDKRLTKMEEDQKFIRRLLIGLIIVGILVLIALAIAFFFQGTRT